jgi:hypothetical protein
MTQFNISICLYSLYHNKLTVTVHYLYHVTLVLTTCCWGSGAGLLAVLASLSRSPLRCAGSGTLNSFQSFCAIEKIIHGILYKEW